MFQSTQSTRPLNNRQPLVTLKLTQSNASYAFTELVQMLLAWFANNSAKCPHFLILLLIELIEENNRQKTPLENEETYEVYHQQLQDLKAPSGGAQLSDTMFVPSSWIIQHQPHLSENAGFSPIDLAVPHKQDLYTSSQQSFKYIVQKEAGLDISIPDRQNTLADPKNLSSISIECAAFCMSILTTLPVFTKHSILISFKSTLKNVEEYVLNFYAYHSIASAGSNKLLHTNDLHLQYNTGVPIARPSNQAIQAREEKIINNKVLYNLYQSHKASHYKI